jgi:UDPglucose--hexose-1-phosphate uridylyltransferase
MADLRRDAATGRLLAVAPARAGRPGGSAAVRDELEACPFCAGREERTPPPTLVLGETSAEPWRVRVVPNLYPALERQEVVVHTPEHVRSIADLDGGQLALVAQAWQRRARAAAVEGFGYVHAFVNEGREAGSSLEHTHSQLAWLRGPPPALAAERGVLSIPAALVVEERDGVASFCAPAGRGAYELCVAPLEPERDAFSSESLAPALALLASSIRRLGLALGHQPPLNAWLHTGVPRWHLELLPRLAVHAGLELGAGVYVAAISPEDAAAALARVDP